MTTIVARESSEKSEPLALPQLEALSSEERRRVEVIQRLESHLGYPLVASFVTIPEALKVFS